jgi:hypothetical protein
MKVGISQQEVIDGLVADAQPVRRVWSPGVRLGVWVVLGATVAVGAAYAGLRPDLGRRLGDVMFLLEVGSLLAAAVLLAGISFAAAVPGREPSRRRFVLAMLLAVGLWMVPLRYPTEAGQPLGEFFRLAFACERRTVVLAVLPLGALLVALRRGAPLAGAVAGCLAGAAAFLLASANMRLICPADSRFHLMVGHVLPVILGIGVATVIGAIWLRRWRTFGLRRWRTFG